MTNKLHDLITRMANELDEYRRLLLDDCTVTHRLSNEARAALADEPAVPDGREPASVTGQPSDEELLETLDKATATFPPRHPEAEGLNAVEYPLALELRKARAVLARWGNPAPQPPADGEVAELVAKLRRLAPQNPLGTADPTITRAADLLERQALVPVPVSERLPGPEDMTDDGEVWIEDPGHEYPLADAGDYDWDPHKWILRPIGKFDAQNGLRWLPAHDLPLPEAGE